ncbi:MAG: hypothetical protein QM766_26820 [Burkholderiaceae bacterium]
MNSRRQTLSHDQLIDWALAEYRACDRQSVVDAFLQGIESNHPARRAAFSAYAITTHLRPHAHTSAAEPSAPCAICGSRAVVEFEPEPILASRWAGAVIAREPVMLAAYLQQHRRSPISVPGEYGLSQFRAILDLIDASEPDETPSTLYRRLRRLPGLRLSIEEARLLLDTLGYAGILQTHQHPGFVYRYTDYLAPRKSRSSEWGYPVDFWKGSDGINVEALSYWFGAYPAIADWRSQKKKMPPA